MFIDTKYNERYRRTTSVANCLFGNIWITCRDVDLFLFLFEQKGATAAQLGQSVFFGSTMAVVYRRLQKLRRLGLIRKVGALREQHLTSVYEITEKCFERFVRQAFDGELKQEQCKSSSHDHDLPLTDIRIHLERSGLIHEFYSENRLCSDPTLDLDEPFRTFRWVGADAAFLYENADGHKIWLALEYESTLKSVNRCKEKVDRYHIDHFYVLWVCANDAILHRFRTIEEEAMRDGGPRLYLCLRDELLSSKEKIHVVTGDGVERNIALVRKLQAAAPQPDGKNGVTSECSSVQQQTQHQDSARS